VATKVAVLACCAAVVGGTMEVQQAAQPAKHPAPHPVVRHAAPVAPLAVTHVVDRLVPPKHAAAPVEELTRDAVPADATPAVTDVSPASDSPVTDQSNGGMLAPDDSTADTTTDATDAPPATTPTTTGTSAPTTTSTSSTGDGAKSGPDGGLTGSSPPTAQGATTPGATKTPS
jgi:hypothetical protein